MEDDDEFGDLYTDVLRPFTAPLQSQFNAQPPPQPTGPSQEKETPKAAVSFQSRPIDLNLNSDDDDEDQDFFGASNSTSNQPPAAPEPGSGTRPDPKGFDLNKVAGQGAGNSGNSAGFFKLDLKDRILEKKDATVLLEEKSFGDSGFMDEADIDVVVEERDEKDHDFVVKDETSVGKSGKVQILMSGSRNATNFGVGGEESKTGDFFSHPVIPGISSAGGGSGGVESHVNPSAEDDWDSDSEDDLQIVLNDPNHGPMGGMGRGEDDEDDDDGDALVIVADNDDPHNQLMIMEEPEWGGEEVGLGDDGERKESGDVSKVNNGGGGPPMAPKIGYSNHGYHQPFPSQFKYVRPGAAPGAPGTAGGTPGQVRPPGNMVPVSGRGRGDWRPAGIKVSPGMQKGFHSGYGPPVWGNGASGRGYGSGLEFTLPSHKTIFEVDIDSFEEKPWRLPGIDVTDFFNFGLNEESWKDYCKQLEQFRLETTMQSKIRVYESGRMEQDYDPDLPPELAAAAGVQEVPSEIAKLGKADDGQIDLSKVPARVKPLQPTGRAIPVETGYGDRLPSVDTRKPRISDLDVIIEIVCQDSADDDCYPGNDMADQRDNDHPIQGISDRNEFEVLPLEDNDDDEQYPSNSSRKSENLRRRSTFSKPVDDDIPEGDESLASEARVDSADSRERTPVYPGRNSISRERRGKVRHGRPRSPTLFSNDGIGGKSFNPDQKEETTESADGNLSPAPLSPVASGDNAEGSVEHKDELSEEIVEVEKDAKINEKEEYSNDTSENDSSKHTSKSQKLSSQVEQAFLQEIDHGEDSKTGRSSDNSKARSGSSKDTRRQHDADEEDEVHDGRPTRVSTTKKYVSGHEVHIRRKAHDERQDVDRHYPAVRDREELYPPKGLNPYPASHALAKYERDRRKEVDNSDIIRQRRDEDMHGRRYRAEETRKREHREEIGSRHRSKIREIERSEKEEHQIRKQLENGSWRPSYDIASKHREREDTLKNRNDVTDDIHSKKRKEETYLRREHTEREETFHAHRETSSRRKRERDDVFDLRRRDDLPRLRDDDQHSGRIKEDLLHQRERDERQREREDWHRLRQSSEEISSRKGKGEESAGLTRGRIIEEKMWASQSRLKDDHRIPEKEYYLKEAGRQKEILKRRDHVENDSLPLNSGREDPYARGTQVNIDERRAKHERASTRDDRVTNTSDGSRMHEKKHKQNSRKGKDSEVVDRYSLPMSRKNHNENSAQTSDMVKLKSRADFASDENKLLGNVPSSKRSRDDASSGDEQAEAKRGRSKLERWTSHKERDFSVGVKATSSMKSKQIDDEVATGPSVTNKLPVELSKISEDEQHPPGNENDAVSLDINNNDLKPIQDRHLDTVEKLKKRSERFKLPMPGEKEITTAKKTETEQLPSAQTENQTDSEVKAERPTRKRRWTSN